MYSMLAAIDLSPVTGGFTALETAILAVAGAVITGALSLLAIKRGGLWIKRLWGSFSS